MYHGIPGDNDRRICPDCETVCPETVRVCPGCGRKFKMIYPPALGRGYLLPLVFVGSTVIGALGAWLSLPQDLLRKLLLLPPAALAIGLLHIFRRYGRHNWQGDSLFSRALAILFIVLCLAALVVILEALGFAAYWAQLR